MTGMRARDRRRTARAVLPLLTVVVLLPALAACSADDPVERQALPSATTVPNDEAEVPSGWTLRQGAGFSVASPGGRQPGPQDQRAAPDAALEVGVPFTGQRHAPPLLLVFVEQGQVGPLAVREPLLRAQLSNALPGATLGSSTHVRVAGSTDAVQFDVRYTTKAATSILDTAMDATDTRQRELVVETPGLPKYGVRYSAPADQFSEQVWQGIVRSLSVRAGDSASGQSAGSGPNA
jgi:hypothetical protein